jgi:hypothetical protein
MSEQVSNVASSNFFKKHLGWVITGFLTLLFWMQTCNLQNKIDQGKKEISQLQLDKQTLDQKVNEQGRVISTQKSILTDNTESLNRLTDTIFDLKAKDKKNLETIAYFKNVTQISVAAVDVPYLDTEAMQRFQDSLIAKYPEVKNYIDSSIRVPTTAGIGTPHFSLQATVKKDGITIDQLTIPDTLQLRFVETKAKLFKRSEVGVQFFHSNPYVKTIQANSAFYKPKRASFFKRVILPVAIGVGAGLLIK